jgi:hypothetical protein
MVLASGDLVTASSTENSDLFWAVRGAGQNFGVVTSFTFQGHSQTTPVFAGPLIFLADKLGQIVEFANQFHERNNEDSALLWGWSCPPPANAPVVLTMLFYNGPEDVARAFFADLVALGPVADMTAMVPYATLNSLLNPNAGFEGRKQFGGGAFKLPMQPAFVEALFGDWLQFVQSHERMNESMMLFETIPYAKVRQVENASCSFSNRGEYYNIGTIFKWFDAGLDDEVREFSRGLLRKASQSAGVVQDGKVRSVEGVGVYGNYSSKWRDSFFFLVSGPDRIEMEREMADGSNADTDVAAEDVYGSNTKKLEELKHKYDPDNLFDRGTRLVPRPLVVVN